MTEKQQETPVERRIVSDDYYGYKLIVPSEFTSNILASEDDKWAVLASIGITRDMGDRPLVAWRNACADEMGIDRAILDPEHGGYMDLGFTSIYVRKFVFFLA